MILVVIGTNDGRTAVVAPMGTKVGAAAIELTRAAAGASEFGIGASALLL